MTRASKEYTDIKVCCYCNVLGRSCTGIGCGPIQCLKSHGWHKSAKGAWYCPMCREKYVDDAHAWTPDWRALQDNVQCEREHYQAWTCSCGQPNWPWRMQCRWCSEHRELNDG